jgi:hypothetical protein
MKSLATRQKGRFLPVCVAFALVMALGVAVTPPALAVIDTSNACPDDIDSAGFTDLAGLDSTTRGAVDCLAEYGITRGTSSTTFSPLDEVSRWQMALFLTRQAEAHGIDLPSGSSVGFLDIAGLSDAAQRAINQLDRLGVAEGTSSTTFSPNESVTRWQMALFLTRLLEEAGIDLPSGSDQDFFDVRVLPSETEKAVNQIIQLDISEGTSSTTFSPNNPVTRWQMALFLIRTLEAGDVEPPEGISTSTRRTTPKVGAPDLVRVSFDDDDDEETRLLFEFDEPVSSDIDGNEIWLVGWNGDLTNPNSVEKSDNDADVVGAIFFNEDYDNAVAGAVTNGAVFDVDNLDNTMGSYPLPGITLQTINWPDDYPELTDVGVFDADDDTVEFEFDQEVDMVGLASDFFLVEQDGTVHEGDVIVDVDDVEEGDEIITVVTIEFTGILQSEWNDVVRAYVDEGTVDEPDDLLLNLPIAVDVSDAGRSDTPYLTGIDLTDADEGIVVFEFNEDLEDINDVASTDFVLVYHDGSTETAGTADRNENDKSEIEVDYGALDSDLVVYATVFDGAVTEFGGTNEDNNVDTYRMQYRFNNGDTAGPDLERSDGSSFGLGDDTYTIVMEFDEDLDDAVAEFTFDPDLDLLAWDEEGELVTLSGGEVTIDGDTMEIEFVDPDPGVEELNDGDVVRFGIFADEIADEFGFTSYPDGGGL